MEDLVDRALAEDAAWSDVTTSALMPPGMGGRARLVARCAGVLAGIEVASLVFRRMDPSVRLDVATADGARLEPGEVIAELEGHVVGMLKGERVALNFLQRLSGIATQTRRYVEAVEGLKARIVDTRKTTPGLRVLEKYAVRMGGGHNHRFNLGDGVLIKDNHLAVLRSQGVSLRDIIARAKDEAPLTLRVEVEANSAQEALEAAEAGADMVMLDNMDLDEMRRAVELLEGRVLLEASGGITMGNVRQVAETGVDFISVGALTHSVTSLDIGLDM